MFFDSLFFSLFVGLGAFSVTTTLFKPFSFFDFCGFEFFFQASVPTNGQIKAKSHRDEAHGFACEGFFVAVAKRLIQAFVLGQHRGAGSPSQGQADGGGGYTTCNVHLCLLD